LELTARKVIRFHLDESAPGAIADGLRRRGIDVTTPYDAGLIGATDEEQLAFALSEHRVVFTHDDDFLRLAARGVSHAGIVYCHARRYRIGEMVNALTRLRRHVTTEEMHGRVEYL
jgi:predicted nuclease of predicted toxin-antitoxin system